MTQQITIFVCETEARADEAVAFRVSSGFPRTTKENVEQDLVYDGTTYGAGGGNDGLFGKWLVTGRN